MREIDHWCRVQEVFLHVIANFRNDAWIYMRLVVIESFKIKTAIILSIDKCKIESIQFHVWQYKACTRQTYHNLISYLVMTNLSENYVSYLIWYDRLNNIGFSKNTFFRLFPSLSFSKLYMLHFHLPPYFFKEICDWNRLNFAHQNMILDTW